jgi:AraC family transcriptional regulator of adaptative response/methylated-DNA-[protein]-cysteine methyltransferase
MNIRFVRPKKNEAVFRGRQETPVGALEVVWSASAIRRIGFGSKKLPATRLLDGLCDPRSRKVWRVAVTGTPFQLAVWRALVKIPFGATTTYGELAARLGRPGAARAVGQAVGANPIAVLIPCHRVLAANGRLGGYYWGPSCKRRLLQHEAALLSRR